MVRHYTLSLTTGAQRLSVVLPDSNASGPTNSDTWSRILIQGDTASTGPVYVGGYGTLISVTGAYGIFVPTPVSSVPAAPIDLGPGALGAWTAIATTGEKLHITVTG